MLSFYQRRKDMFLVAQLNLDAKVLQCADHLASPSPTDVDVAVVVGSSPQAPLELLGEDDDDDAAAAGSRSPATTSACVADAQRLRRWLHHARRFVTTKWLQVRCSPLYRICWCLAVSVGLHDATHSPSKALRAHHRTQPTFPFALLPWAGQARDSLRYEAQ